MHRPDVGAMLAELDSDQLSTWMAYLRVDHSQALRAGAMVAATVANAMGDGRRTWHDADFLPAARTGPAEEMDADEIKSALMGLTPGDV